MRIEVPNTTISELSKSLVSLREEEGASTLGRVLTLIIVTVPAHEEEAIDAANAASHEHPMRVLVISEQPDADDAEARLDGEIRIGGDAGASEVIVLRAYGEVAREPESLVTGLLLPDAPIVAWWYGSAPERVATTGIGRIATRRITDIRARRRRPTTLHQLASNSAPGDTDLAWSRITLWRSQLAAVLDQPPYLPVTAVRVVGATDSPSAQLLAAWLGLQLDCPVTLETPYAMSDEDAFGVESVRLERENGAIELVRTSSSAARLTQPGQPVHEVAIPQRTNRECLAEELRRLDPDEVYERVLTEGLTRARTVEE